jgi:hypothetical protein
LSDLILSQIEHGSAAYEDTIALRDAVGSAVLLESL